MPEQRVLSRTSSIVAATLALGALAGCSGPGLDQITQDNSSFADCVRGAGATTESSGDWDGEQARAFWSEPGTLDCAVDELDRDARRNALATAFPELDDDATDSRDELFGQWQVVADWTTTSAGSRPVEEVVERATVLLASTWVSDSDFPATNGTVGAAVLGAMRGGDELGSYETYLREHPDDEDSADLLVSFGTGTNIPNETSSRYFALRDDAVDVVRD